MGLGHEVGTKVTGQKRLVLVSGRAHQQLAEEIASLLGIELVPTTAYDFANGETAAMRPDPLPDTALLRTAIEVDGRRMALGLPAALLWL